MFCTFRLRALGVAVALGVGAPGLWAQTATLPAPAPAPSHNPWSAPVGAPNSAAVGVVPIAASTAAAPHVSVGSNPGAAGMPQAPTWAQALDAAWARSAESAAAAAAAQVAGAEQAAAQAWLPGAPVFEAGWRTDQLNRNTGAREAELALVLPLWLPGQRQASAQQAQAAAAVAQASASAQRLQLAQTLLDAAATVQQQRLALEWQTSEVQTLRLLASDVQRLMAAGERARSDSLAAQAELLQAQALLQHTRSELQRAERHWHSLTGLSAVAPIAALGAPSDAADPTALAQHPLLLEADARSQWALRQLALIERSRRAAPELQARWVQQTEARGATATQSAGLTLRLPLHSAAQHNPRLVAAQGAYAHAQAQQQQLERQLQAQWAQQQAALAGLQAQIAHQAQRAEQLRERAALIEKSFRSGETALADWLRTRAGAAQAAAELQTLRLQQQIAQARLQLNLGILP
ncbi:MAG: transporter [Comamonadaceae bacterium]|nr:transporter [Comamonadaceae bacterium]